METTKKQLNAVEAVKEQFSRRDERQLKRDRLALLLAETLEEQGFDIGSIEFEKEDHGPFRQEMSIRVSSSFRKGNRGLKWPL